MVLQMGSYIYYSEDFLDAIELISSESIELKKIITQEIPLEEIISTGFKLMRDKQCVKVITHP